MPAPRRFPRAPAKPSVTDCTAVATGNSTEQIHIIALGRVAWDPETRAYIERRVSDGKTKREAIRCLKRHIARQIWQLLYNTQPAAPAIAERPMTHVKAGAPTLMPCIR